MTFLGFFVDDNADEASVFSELLSEPNDGIVFSIQTIGVLTDLAKAIFDAKPNIVAIDYRLDETPIVNIGRPADYKGSGLTQLLRDQAVGSIPDDFPIVLISAEAKLRQAYNPDQTAHDLFDRIYVKENISTQYRTIKVELQSLCQAYLSLKKEWAGPDRLSVLGLPRQEAALVFNQTLTTYLRSAGTPHIASRYLLKNVVDRTGLLYSDADVSARLGIADRGIDQLVPFFNKANLQYSGVFSTGWRRWWAHRFDQWAEAFFGQRPTSISGAERVHKINDLFGLSLVAARSTWNDSVDELFAFSCASCGRPAEIRHSVSLFDGPVPDFCVHRRACWDCVQSDRLEHNGLEVENYEESLARRIKSLPKGTDLEP